MSEWICKECGDSFESRRGLHQHMKCHFTSIGEYYVKHFPRKDLFTQDQLPFKTYDQYFAKDFVSFDNYMKWIKTAPRNEVKEYVLNRFTKKADQKGLKSMPPNLLFDLYNMPNRFTLEKLWGDYSNFCLDTGLSENFTDDLPYDFWNTKSEDMKILIDTREQLPMHFPNSISQKLDFGDYTAAGEHYSKTFVDRKSQDDFRSTFGKDIDRFRREMDRCVKFGSYMFVVIESSIDKIEEDNKHNKFKSNLTYLWHNVRDMIAAYPNNIQFIFAHNRAGAKKIIPHILYHGQSLWDVDLQYYIDQRVYGAQHVYQLS